MHRMTPLSRLFGLASNAVTELALESDLLEGDA
jgi:hypothetical protein